MNNHFPSVRPTVLPTKDLTGKPEAVTQLHPVTDSPSSASGNSIEPLPGVKTLGQAAFGALATANKARRKTEKPE